MAFTDNISDYKVWVFAPYLATTDPNLEYYYDYTQSIAEYTKVFGELNCEWEWLNITIENLNEQIEKVNNHTAKTNIVLNLCDGDEINGVPGISVIEALTSNHIIYTGADAYFYNITTSKITMKEAFAEHDIAMPKWLELTEDNDTTIFDIISDTIIIKPAISAGSMGLNVKNVVSNIDELNDLLLDIKKGYRGWKLDEAGLIAEQFIIGKEFTTFLTGSSQFPETIQFYSPVERVFHASLPEKEQFLSFDRLWEIYEEESPMPDDGYLYEYAGVDSPELVDELKELSIRAFNAVGGTGYARLDMRMDKDGNLYVLEINAQCGISDDENYTSIGAILRFSNKTFTNLVVEILDDALLRHKQSV